MLVLVPKLRIPYPILLVLGGLALGFVPGLPEIDLPPDLVLVGVLPPLLYGAAFFTSLRDLRANLRPVGLLAVGLVLLTMVVVAVVAHEIVPGLPWAAAFVLGAVVSPTDPIAATAIMQRLGVPRRLVSIVEGESLVNDGTALVAYRFAVVAAVSGTFSLWEAGIAFVLNVAGGVVVGLGVAWIVRQVRRRLDFPPAEVTISLLTGYFAYIPAELMGVSAVIAAVTAGIYLGWYTPELTTPEVRLMGESAWEIVTFTLNAILFTLIGLQLPGILDELDAYSTADLLWWARRDLADRARRPRRSGSTRRRSCRACSCGGSASATRCRPPAALALITWSGMRGAVSLAAALAIPLTTDAGEPFPERNLILFLTFAVIFGTLVIQGLTLPAVIRLLRLEDDGEDDAREEAQARIHAASAALRPARRARRRGLGARRHGRAGPRRLRLPPEPLLGVARRRRRRLDRGALARLPAAPPRAAERRAGRRAASCGVAARSRTRWRGASCATSTSRTRGSRSDGDVERPPRLARAGVRALARRTAAPRAATRVGCAGRGTAHRRPARRGGGDGPAGAAAARARARRRDALGGRPGRESRRAPQRHAPERSRRRPEPELPLRQLERRAVVHLPARDRPRAAQAAEPHEPLLTRPRAGVRAGNAGVDGARPGAAAEARARPARADRADPRPRRRPARAGRAAGGVGGAPGASPSSRSARPAPSTSGCSSRGSRRSSTRSSTPGLPQLCLRHLPGLEALLRS